MFGHGRAARSTIGVSTLGKTSVQWWLRFGRRCLQSTVLVSESGIEAPVGSGVGESTMRAASDGLNS